MQMDYCEIRENGEIEVLCPECGERLSWRDEVYVLLESETVVGCSLCLRRINGQEWYSQKPEYEYWEE